MKSSSITTSISDLENYLKRFSCFDALELIGKTSLDLYNKNIVYRYFSFNTDKGVVSQILSQWGLACIAYRLILSSNDGRKETFRLLDLIEASNIFINLYDPFLSDQDLSGFLGRTEQEQFWWQDKRFYDLARTYILYELIAPKYKDKLNFDCTGEFTNAFGLTLADFILIGVYILAYVGKKTVSFGREDLKKHNISRISGVITDQNLDKWLMLTTLTYKGLRKESAEINKYTKPGYERFEFNPLFKFPIVEGDRRFPSYIQRQFVVPNILLLLYKLTDGIYWIFSDLFHSKDSDRFRIAIGKIFEFYVGELLNKYFGEHNVEHLDPNEYRGKIADWLVHTEGTDIIIECKASLLPLTLRQCYNRNDFEQWIDRVFIDAVQQLDNTEKSLRSNGRITSSGIRKIIVLYEKLRLVESPLYREVINETIHKKMNINLRFDVMTIDELEDLEKPIKEHGFIKIFHQKDKMLSEQQLGMGRGFRESVRQLGCKDPTNEWLLKTLSQFLSISFE